MRRLTAERVLAHSDKHEDSAHRDQVVEQRGEHEEEQEEKEDMTYMGTGHTSRSLPRSQARGSARNSNGGHFPT